MCLLAIPDIRASVPAFGAHIGHIVFMGSEEEMIGADATWIVAAVQNTHTRRYRAEGEFPGHPMGKGEWAITVATDPGVTPDLPVATEVMCPQPVPTVRPTFNLDPEAICQKLPSHTSICFTAKSRRPIHLITFTVMASPRAA